MVYPRSHLLPRIQRNKYGWTVWAKTLRFTLTIRLNHTRRKNESTISPRVYDAPSSDKAVGGSIPKASCTYLWTPRVEGIAPPPRRTTRSRSRARPSLSLPEASSPRPPGGGGARPRSRISPDAPIHTDLAPAYASLEDTRHFRQPAPPVSFPKQLRPVLPPSWNLPPTMIDLLDQTDEFGFDWMTRKMNRTNI